MIFYSPDFFSYLDFDPDLDPDPELPEKFDPDTKKNLFGSDHLLSCKELMMLRRCFNLRCVIMGTGTSLRRAEIPGSYC